MADPAIDPAGQLLDRLKRQTVKVEGPDGNVVDVTPEQAHQGFVSGAVKYLPGETYYVRDDATGQAVPVDAQTAAQTSARQRYTADFAAPSEEARARAEAEYGGLGSQLATAAEGALDELTFGAVPLAGRAIGGDAYANRRAIQEEINPGSDVVGRGVGLGVGLLYGAGEVGAAAKGAGLATRGLRAAALPTRGLMAAGEAVEAGTRALAGAAGLMEGGLATRALSGAARGALEGFAFAEGSELSRQAVHDPELDAERLLSAGLNGAMAGGVIGAALPVAGAGLMRGGRAVASKATELAEWGAQKAESAIVGGAERAAGDAAGLEARRAALARQEALKSTGAGKRLMGELTGDVEALSDQGKRLADRVLFEAEKDTGKALGRMSREEGMAWAESRRAKAGAQIEEALTKAEAAVPGAPPEIYKVFDQLGDEAVALSKNAASHTAGKEAFAYMQRLAEQVDGAGLRALQQARVELDRMAGWGVPIAKPLQSFYQKLSRELEGVVETTIARAEAAGASGLSREYLGAKNAYQDFKQLQKMYTEGVDRMRANRIGGLSEQLALSGGGPVSSFAQGVGAGVGSLFGVPGAFVGRELAGAVGRMGDAALQRAIKARGSAVAAQTLRDLPETGLLRGGVNAARGLLGDMPAAAKVLSGAERLASPEARARALDYVTGKANAAAQAGRRVATGPTRGVSEQTRRQDAERLKSDRALARARVTGQQLERQFGPVPAVTALAARYAATTKALTEPEVPPAPGTVTGPRLPESQAHVDKLAARRATLGRPEALLLAASRGAITADQIETMSQVLPKALELARANAEATLAGATRETPMANLVAASLILGRPADPALQPHVLGAVQASLQKQRTAQAQQQGAARSQNAALARMTLPRTTTSDVGAEPGLVGGPTTI